jgi:transcription elongation factor Elf1
MDAMEIIKRDNYTCKKCGYMNIEGKGLVSIDIEDGIILCDICNNYAPKDIKRLKNYVNEKIDGRILDTFRKTRITVADRTKAGMQKKVDNGEVISRAPKGYKIIDKKLVIDESNAFIIKKLFEEYANNDISLSKLAQKYGLTTSGVIKVLNNKTYIGMLNRHGTDIKGSHEPIIAVELFLKVQEKMKENK